MQLEVESFEEFSQPQDRALAGCLLKHVYGEKLKLEVLEFSLPPQKEEKAHAVFPARHSDDNSITGAEKIERFLGPVETLDEPKYQWRGSVGLALPQALSSWCVGSKGTVFVYSSLILRPSGLMVTQ